mmetsp:Transcript_87969/g.252116  ORF Transcript_87969/g.252116 Transcript_87969/m.252116 type:complete len:340 (-) Transcript_87969:706-1725(-)
MRLPGGGRAARFHPLPTEVHLQWGCEVDLMVVTLGSERDVSRQALAEDAKGEDRFVLGVPAPWPRRHRCSDMDAHAHDACVRARVIATAEVAHEELGDTRHRCEDRGLPLPEVLSICEIPSTLILHLLQALLDEVLELGLLLVVCDEVVERPGHGSVQDGLENLTVGSVLLGKPTSPVAVNCARQKVVKTCAEKGDECRIQAAMLEDYLSECLPMLCRPHEAKHSPGDHLGDDVAHAVDQVLGVLADGTSRCQQVVDTVEPENENEELYQENALRPRWDVLRRLCAEPAGPPCHIKGGEEVQGEGGDDENPSGHGIRHQQRCPCQQHADICHEDGHPQL